MTETMNDEASSHVGKKQKNGKKRNQEYEVDSEELAQDSDQKYGDQTVTAACQDSTKSNSVLPLAVVSCSDLGQDEVSVSATGAAGKGHGRRMGQGGDVEATHGDRGGQKPRRLWVDCRPHIALLREALLCSAPDIAVLGPLHACFSFYMTHLHNTVLSSSYARTLTLGANVTRLESAFMWVGGWRPTSALVLVYSLMGIEIEDAIANLSTGREVGQGSTSCVLSTRQLAVMHNLQKHTQHAEMRISKKVTLLQMLIGDQDVLEAVLLDAASLVANDSSKFNQVAEKRLSRFRRIVVQAEELRLHTLKDLLSLLTPIQAARCGVAVFEMCSALRIMGCTILPTLLPLTPMLTQAVPVNLLVLSAPTPLVGSITEPTNPLLLLSYDVLHIQSDESLDSDIAAHDKKTNSRPATIRQSDDESLLSDAPASSNVSDVLLSHYDEGAIPVAYCSSTSSESQVLLPRGSSEGFDKEKVASESLSSNVDDDTDEMCPAAPDEKFPKTRESADKFVSSRILVLSPSSSDVAIQSCNVKSFRFPACIEIQQSQLPPVNADIAEECYQVLRLLEIGDGGEACHVQLADDGEESDQEQRRSTENGDVGGSSNVQAGEIDCDQLFGHNSNMMSALCEFAHQ